MKIASTAFNEGGLMPDKFSYLSSNFSPPLKWDHEPSQTKTYALICEDPDAPSGNWIHWIVFNIPRDMHALPEHFPMQKELSNGIKQGTNDFHTIGYGGPAPPSGMHRYIFKLYALDSKLNLKYGVSKKELFNAMQGHILDEAKLIGKYKK